MYSLPPILYRCLSPRMLLLSDSLFSLLLSHHDYPIDAYIGCRALTWIGLHLTP